MDEFKEKVEFADALVDEIKEKLGDDAAKVSEQLLGIRTTINDATELHAKTLEEKAKTDEYNQELLNVNNKLFIQGSANARTMKTEDEREIDEMDDPDEALDSYINAKVGR